MAVVLEGAIGFIGFSQILVWCPDFAKEFGEAAISGGRDMAKGATLGAAEKIRKCFAQLAKTLSESFDKSGAENAILGMIAAHWNQTHVELKGDESATLARTGKPSQRDDCLLRQPVNFETVHRRTLAVPKPRYRMAP